ncbi:electron carrier/ protein disulfide oxidoreductase [Anaeramoeba flamelloides]|uniref:Electron carrier/ protein disulfide oxidoreductase n=1 Tax=Anaeramoeba flamelloides TaxID=1746091 RepID=A0AAV7Z7L9_9EUKA|nr:electron carrier/ protein disulfide oxidoreductase [Anaeramoeba flamelloides]
MGNEIHHDNSQQQKLSSKAFKKLTKKRLVANTPILFIDQYQRVIQLNTKVSQILNRKIEEIFGAKIESLAPKKQIHYGEESVECLKKQTQKLLTTKQETLKIIWSFLGDNFQSKKDNSEKKDKEKENENENKQDQNNNLIWVKIDLKKLFVESSVIVEAKMEKIEKPIELLKQRSAIEKLKKQMASVERKLQEHSSLIEKSNIPERTHAVFEKISKQVSITNMIREKYSPITTEIDKTQELLKVYEPQTKEYQRQVNERQKMVNQKIRELRVQKKKLSIQAKNVEKKNSRFDNLRQINLAQLKTKKLKKENKTIKEQYKEIEDLFSKKKDFLLTFVKTKERFIMGQSKYKKQTKEIEELNGTLDTTNNHIKILHQRMKTTNRDQKLEEEILQLKHQIKKYANLNNNMKSQIAQSKLRKDSDSSIGNANQNNSIDFDKKKLSVSISSESIKVLHKTKSVDHLCMKKFITSPSLNDISKLNRKFFDSKRNTLSLKSMRDLNVRKDKTLSVNLKNKLLSPKKKEKRSKTKRIVTSEDLNKFNEPIEHKHKKQIKIRSNSSETKKKNLDAMKNHTQFKTIDELTKFPITVEYFREYLSDRFKQEPLLFYLACQNFKKYYNQEIGEELSDYIIEKYIIQGGLFHLEFPDEISKVLIKNWKISEFSSGMLDAAQQYVYETLIQKNYALFKDSLIFQELLNLDFKENSLYNYSGYKMGAFISETKNNKILNSSFKFKGTARNPIKIIENLIENLIDTLDAHYSRRMNMIHCDSLESSILFKKFIVASGELQKVNLNYIQTLPDESKKIFFINLYNIICIHSLVVNQFPTTPNSLLQFLSTSIYQLDSSFISLSDIKYHILQLSTTNKKISKLPILCEQIQKLEISQGDPRIHFALLSLSSETCLLQAYTSQNLDQQLDFASQEFLKKYLSVDNEKKIINLPYTIEEGYKDFGYNQMTVLIFLRNFWEFDDPLSLYSYQLKSLKTKIEIYIELY